MSREIISALVIKRAISDNAIITASYDGHDLFGRVFVKVGEFKLTRIITSNSHPIFELKSIDNFNNIVRTTSDNIHTIDGMDIIRYAEIYDILPDGSSKRIGRKRGRKSKKELAP